jgi:hypothetical protein
VLEDHLAPTVDRGCRRQLGRLLLGVEQLEDPLGGRDPGLQQVDHGRHLGQWLGELA